MKIQKITRDIERDFTIIPNHILLDDRLSAEARWAMCYLLSRPDGWQHWRTHLMKAGGFGKTVYERIVKELTDAGYYHSVTGGSGGGGQLYVYVYPEKCPKHGDRETRYPQNTVTVKQGHLVSTEKDSNTKKDNNTDKHLGGEEGFDEFWDAYPRGHRVDKKGCCAKWKGRKLAGKASEILADVRQRVEADGNWMRGFIPQTTTYLNQSRWESDLAPVRQDKNDKRNPWDHAREVLENY